MINLSFNIRSPFSNRFECIANPNGPISKHKHWELQFDRTSDIIGFDFRITHRQDHAGLFVSFALFGYDVMFHIYDTRHWDHTTNTWAVYD